MSEENAVVSTSHSGLSPTWIYVLYLVALFTGVPVLVGLILAYISRGEAGEPEASHYRYQIRTFWIGLAYVFLGALLTPALGLGILLCLFAWIFVLVRSIKGLQWYNRGEVVPNPKTWWF